MASPYNIVDKQLKVIEGCRALNIPKGAKLLVTNIKELGAEYSYSVRVEFTYAGRHIHLYARHINRLSDHMFNMNNGNPLKKIRVSLE